VAGCGAGSDVYSAHFSFPLPTTAKLCNYYREKNGFDSSHAFSFHLSNEDFVKTLVDEWSLNEKFTATTSVSKSPKWWPTHEARRRMTKQYGWMDEQRHQFRSAWFDKGSMTLYVEYGDW